MLRSFSLVWFRLGLYSQPNPATPLYHFPNYRSHECNPPPKTHVRYVFLVLFNTRARSIPELSINPLAQRLVRSAECPNFRDFVKLVAPFSPRASRDDRLAFIFQVGSGGLGSA